MATIDLDVTPNIVPNNGDYTIKTINGARVKKQCLATAADELESIELATAAFWSERNRLFAETEWARQRHSDRIESNIDDAANWKEWLDYWQALRELEEQEDFDPRKVIWPTRPYRSEKEEALTIWQRLFGG